MQLQWPKLPETALRRHCASFPSAFLCDLVLFNSTITIAISSVTFQLSLCQPSKSSLCSAEKETSQTFNNQPIFITNKKTTTLY